MAFDRSKYTGTSVKQLQKKEEELQEKLPQKNSNFTDFLSIDEGKNYFRIYPSKPDEDTYIFSKCTHWLPQLTTKEDGTKEWRRKPVFNARFHGSFEKDLIEEFQKIARKRVEDKYEGYQPDAEDLALGIKDAKKKINTELWPIESWRDGIGISTGWVFYAEKYDVPNKNANKAFGRVEVWDSIYREMKKRAAALEDPSQGFIDPFSDPDDGKLLVITKTTTQVIESGKSKKKVDYSVDIHYMTQVPLEDSDLIKFDEVTPLSTLFINSYKRSDFDKVLQGLEKIEEDHGYGVFQEEEFLDLVEFMESKLPEEEKTDSETPKPSSAKTTSKVSVEVKEEIPEPEEDIFDLPISELVEKLDRKKLKQYIKDNSLDEVMVKGSMGDEQIRELILEAVEAREVKEKMSSKLTETVEKEGKTTETPVKEKTVDSEIDRITKGKVSEEVEEKTVEDRLAKYKAKN